MNKFLLVAFCAFMFFTSCGSDPIANTTEDWILEIENAIGEEKKRLFKLGVKASIDSLKSEDSCLVQIASLSVAYAREDFIYGGSLTFLYEYLEKYVYFFDTHEFSMLFLEEIVLKDSLNQERQEKTKTMGVVACAQLWDAGFVSEKTYKKEVLEVLKTLTSDAFLRILQLRPSLLRDAKVESLFVESASDEGAVLPSGFAESFISTSAAFDEDDYSSFFLTHESLMAK